jgi:hypothetical protein
MNRIHALGRGLRVADHLGVREVSLRDKAEVVVLAIVAAVTLGRPSGTSADDGPTRRAAP